MPHELIGTSSLMCKRYFIKAMDPRSFTMYRFLFHCKGTLAHLLGRTFIGKMQVRYWGKNGTNPRYVCQGEFYYGGSYCQSFSAIKTDRVFEEELFRAIEPAALQASIILFNDDILTRHRCYSYL